MPAPSLLYILLFAAFMLNPVPAQKESRHRHAEKRPSTEPFRSFAILDSQLSLLTTQQSALQASESSGPALPLGDSAVRSFSPSGMPTASPRRGPRRAW